MARTLYQKLWDAHVVDRFADGTALLYIDRHFLHEVTSPQAFAGLRARGLPVRRPAATMAMADHVVTTARRDGIEPDPDARALIATLEGNAAAAGIPWVPFDSPVQGIVHVVGPERGITLPGMTIACGDSHSSTHGALGALALGIGTSDVEHVLATQTLRLAPARTMRIVVEGALGPGVFAKDLILAIIGRIGTASAAGHVLEFAGGTIRTLDLAGRMTICNMAVEAGARTGLIGPDDVTFAYLRGRRFAPAGAAWTAAVDAWRTLGSDPDARFDREVQIDAATIEPQVSWGTSPEDVVAVTGRIPEPAGIADPARRDRLLRALAYMDLQPGQPIAGTAIDIVFVGSCTNARIEDLRAAAAILRGRRIAAGIRAIAVPGSGMVKAQAEEEGLDRVFRDAGFEWHAPGCSLCAGINADRLTPGQRCASTSNRNFEGRQGPGGRTHLLSPAMAAAAAVTGCITDVRALQ